MSQRYQSPSRRTFLRLAASAGTASLFGRLLWPDVAEAQTAPPLRYLGIMTMNGKVPTYWNPQGAGDAFNIDFPDSSLRPLQPFRSKLLVFRNLDLKVLTDRRTTGHYTGPAALFTGSTTTGTGNAAVPSSASLDVYLANRLGGSTPLRSIQIVTHADWCSDESNLSYSESGQKLPNLWFPQDIYTRLFGGFTGPSSTPAVDPKARRQGLVDFWLADANRMRAQLAPSEQRKLDVHLDGLRDVERRIAALSSPAASCSVPPAPRNYTREEVSGHCWGLTGERLIPERTRIILDVLAHAFACDRTRFASMLMSTGIRAAFGNYVTDVTTQDIHSDLGHRWYEPGPGAALNRLNVWTSEQVAYFLGKLQSFSDGDGTLLDHSIVLWGNELSVGTHENTDQPFVLAGGANGRFRTGRLITSPVGTPHNRLLTSIARAFDQNVTHFGHPDYRASSPG